MMHAHFLVFQGTEGDLSAPNPQSLRISIRPMGSRSTRTRKRIGRLYVTAPAGRHKATGNPVVTLAAQYEVVIGDGISSRTRDAVLPELLQMIGADRHGFGARIWRERIWRRHQASLEASLPRWLRGVR